MKNRKKYISIFAVASLTLSLSAFVILELAKSNVSLADSLNDGPCMSLRRALAWVSNFLPFSIFELLAFLSPVLLVLIIFRSVRVFKSGQGRVKHLLNIVSVLLTVYILYVFTLGIPYHTTTLSDKIGLDEVEVNTDNLKETAEILINEINVLADRIEWQDGVSVMPYDIDTLSEKLSASYAEFSEKNGIFPEFNTRAKPIFTSGVMSSLRILGIYTFFTGESNINTAYPDFDRPYTVAHEFAHQRGVMRENDANFLAFLVCIESGDDYIKYSAYVRLYEYIRSSLYRADKEIFAEVDAALSVKALSDIKASYAVTEKYGETLIGEISDKLNDLYLKQNGTEGTVSYGLVTRLAVAYYSDRAE